MARKAISEFLCCEILPVGPLQANAIFLYDKQHKDDACIVDPGGDAEVIVRTCVSKGLKVSKIICTHAHMDHCMGVQYVKENCPVSPSISSSQSLSQRPPVFLHNSDIPLWQNLLLQCRLFGIPCNVPNPDNPDSNLDHGMEISVGRFKGRVVHTPGHSPGSICLHFPENKLVITGDTLFRLGIGRSDLTGGDHRTLVNSIRNRLFSMPEDTRAIPGHGDETTIGYEKNNNYSL